MNTQKEVIAAIAKHLAVTPADIDISASLAEDLGLGPLEKADLLSNLSSQFKVTFDPLEVENIETVHDIVVMIEDLLIE
ncbi:acyl carrier protein [Candidatus Daviesbacteria bacterium]|nr:acyl carrier protein [Candidatus Daviesbacteria bacterium]